MGIVLNNNQIPDLRYIFDDYDKWTNEQLFLNKELFTNAKEVLKKLGNPKDFAWYGAEIRELEYEEKSQLKDKIEELNATIKALKGIMLQLVPVVNVLLPHLKKIPEINQESLAKVEKITQIATMMSSENLEGLNV